MSILKLLHFSDLHGRAFAEASRLTARFEPDWLVLTGDIIPGHLHRDSETQFQKQNAYWTRHRHHFLKPAMLTTYLRGNHEGEHFLDPELHRQVPPSLAGRVGFLEGIPAEFGPWGFPRELDNLGLQAELESQGNPDVILSHVPPFGCLDLTRRGVAVGHRPLANRLADCARAPALVLCGHVHESWGHARIDKTLVVNAAGGGALIRYDTDAQRAELLVMRHLVHPVRWLADLFRGQGLPDWLWKGD